MAMVWVQVQALDASLSLNNSGQKVDWVSFRIVVHRVVLGWDLLQFNISQTVLFSHWALLSALAAPLLSRETCEGSLLGRIIMHWPWIFKPEETGEDLAQAQLPKRMLVLQKDLSIRYLF